MTPDTANLDAIAEEIAHETTLTQKEALVLAATRAGQDDSTVGKLIGRSGMTVERIRSNLREKRRELPGEIEKRQRTLDALEEL